MLLLSLFAGTMISGSAGVAQALASHSQVTYFEASSDLLEAKTRAQTIAKLQHLGVHALRVELYWEEVAPGADSATHRASKRPTRPPTTGATTPPCSPKPSAWVGRCC